MHCPTCGQNLAESRRKENTWAYRAEAVSCHGCRAIHREAKRLDEDGRAGISYRVWKIDVSSNGSG